MKTDLTTNETRELRQFYSSQRAMKPLYYKHGNPLYLENAYIPYFMTLWQAEDYESQVTQLDEHGSGREYVWFELNEEDTRLWPELSDETHVAIMLRWKLGKLMAAVEIESGFLGDETDG